MNVPFRLLLITALLTLGASPATAEWKAVSRLQQRLAEAAIDQTRERVVYDGSYRVIAYPGGDVPRDRGVCSDVIIRAYRELGIDLQVLVHEDMAAHFSLYPHDWGLAQPDSNIDHRRVPNLQTFFVRNGEKLRVTPNPLDYEPGDLVTWVVDRSLPHIGIVSAELNSDGARPLMIHNIGDGPQLEDMLFAYPITGHYRYPAAN